MSESRRLSADYSSSLRMPGFSVAVRASCSRGDPRLVRLLPVHRAHDEKGVTGRIEQIKRASAPRLILRRAKDGHLGAPFPVIRIRIVHLERNAGVAAMALHGAIERQLDGPAFQAEKTGVAGVGNLKAHEKAQAVNVELLGSGQVCCWKNRYGAFHRGEIKSNLPGRQDAPLSQHPADSPVI